MNEEDIVIVAAKRTAIGSFQGQFASVSAPELGAAALKACLHDSQLEPVDIDEVLMGCVLSAGLGQAPARQAALLAGLEKGTPCTTVNKVCGSGMKTVMLAYDAIRAGSIKTALAGGMESMSNAPYLLPGARSGYRMGHQQALDHMFYDGLQNPYDQKMMGDFAELCASEQELDRELQDELAKNSVLNAQKAITEGLFNDEICPVDIKTRKEELRISQDEEPGRMNIEKIPQLRPAFKRDGGTVTAANASKISDGAAALLLMRSVDAETRGLKPLARIVAHASHAREPEWFTVAPVDAMQKVLDKAGWQKDDVDLWEINEAFAVVTLAAIKQIELDERKVNVHGGATALGHPIGASGARLLVTLIYALQQRSLNKGVASLCIGGGEATAIAVEIA